MRRVIAGVVVSVEEADEVGLGVVEQGGEVARGGRSGEPEVAEAVETVGVVLKFDGLGRRKGE